VHALALFIARSDRLGGVVVTLLTLVVLREILLSSVHQRRQGRVGCCLLCVLREEEKETLSFYLSRTHCLVSTPTRLIFGHQK
jgi:hypothetical protein